VSSAAVVNGVAYVGSDLGNLYAVDAKTGTSLWIGTTDRATTASPTVSGGVVYISAADNTLYAFDAAGNTNCSGSPKTCAPLWTGSEGTDGAPLVANGFVYIAGKDRNLYAFDAGGNTSCSGTPKTCTPLWRSSTTGYSGGSPALANGIVHVATDGIPVATIYAFDANGTTGCSGMPKTCAPLWSTAALGSGSAVTNPLVVNGVLYGPDGDGDLRAYDANGNTNCSGSPKTCDPIWTAVTGSDPSLSGLNASVANGTVFVDSFDGTMYTFDPNTGTPLWTAPTGPNNFIYSAPAIANGVVYVHSWLGLWTFDAGGTTNCSGTPKVCAPLFHDASSIRRGMSSPAIANGFVYVNAFTNSNPFPGALTAYGLAPPS
jgi:outer membrane protein assembly factor BamB